MTHSPPVPQLEAFVQKTPTWPRQNPPRRQDWGVGSQAKFTRPELGQSWKCGQGSSQSRTVTVALVVKEAVSTVASFRYWVAVRPPTTVIWPSLAPVFWRTSAVGPSSRTDAAKSAGRG